MSGDDADIPAVEDALGAQSRWNWNSVTDTGGSPRADEGATRKTTSFQFDLGSALQRIGDPDPAETVPGSAPSAVSAAAPPMPLDRPTPPGPQSLEGPLPRRDSSSPEPLAQPGFDSAPAHAPLPPLPPVVEQPLPRRSPGSSPAAARQPQERPFEQSRPLPSQITLSPERSFQQSPVVQPPVVQPPVVQPPVVQPPVVQPPVVQGYGGVPVEPTYDHYQPSPGHQVPPPASVFEAALSTPLLPQARDGAARGGGVADPALPAGHHAPVLPAVSGALPTLPAVNPVIAPPIAAPITSTAASTDLTALRSAQLRANRQQKQGKLFGRSLLAFFVIGGLIAGALVFGRSYLFTTDWDAALTPIVDDIQLSTGIEFDQTVPLVVQPDDQYATSLLAATVGDQWVEQVPAWRAFGIANGDVVAAQVASELALRQPAFYDPTSNTIYRAEGADEDQLRAALEMSLLAALEHQLVPDTEATVVESDATGVTGVSSPQSIARRAVDSYLIERAATPAAQAARVTATPDAIPIPIAYEIAAVDQLGGAILAAAGAEPDTVELGDVVPDGIYGVLDDAPVRAVAATLLPEDRPLADPMAIGVDDWALVWGARLPTAAVGRLVEIVRSDSYQPIARGGTVCFISVFETATEANATTVLGSMQLWAQRGPIESGAVATQVGPRRIQLESCDPGPTIEMMPDVATVDRLIDIQIARLTG